jgi:hypothetical protein
MLSNLQLFLSISHIDSYAIPFDAHIGSLIFDLFGVHSSGQSNGALGKSKKVEEKLGQQNFHY